MDTPAPSNIDLNRANECREYVSGVLEALSVLPNIICWDDDLTPDTIVRVYIKYMDEHPILFDMARIIGIYGALRRQFPCKK